jgi:hypothetical protein
MKFRKLKASEIDARVSTVSDSGCSLLLYKDARVDQNILDEEVGCLNWQREHQLIGDRLYCTVSIWDEKKKQWIKKQDVGTESYTEKEKGQASDSFKRACFNLGIGRELYTAPFIWIDSKKCTIKNKNGKYTTYDHFEVEEIGYDEDGVINRLVIRNKGTTFSKRNDIVFMLGEAETDEQKEQQKMEELAKEKITDIQLKSLKLTIENNPNTITEKGVLDYFKLKKLEDMTTGQLGEFMKLIKGDDKGNDKAGANKKS